MHIALVGPINISSLAEFLNPADRVVALEQPDANGTAPGVIAGALLAAGHSATVVTHRRGQGALSLSGERLRVVQVPSRSNRLIQISSRWDSEIKAMTSAIQLSGADVVHSNWAYEAALASVRSGLPHVATMRDAPLTVLYYDPRPTRLVRATMAYEFRLRSARATLTAVSPYMASKWKRQTLSRELPTVIPNIAPSHFRRSATPAEHPLFVEVADAGRRKNVKGLLKAFALTLSRLPNAEMMLIGDGLHSGGALHRWAQKTGNDTRVRFRGKLDRGSVAEALSKAWAHVHAAYEETLGNTLLEAMSAGIPVIGGAGSAAVPWVLGGGSAGLLTDVTDPRRLADAMTKLAESSELRSRLAREGLNRAQTVFAPGTIVKQYASQYEAAISRHRLRGD